MLSASGEVMYYLGPVLSIFGAGGGAWLALKVGLNGAKERIYKIEKTTDRIETSTRESDLKLSVLEARHENLTQVVKEHPITCPWQRPDSARTRRGDD